MTLHRFAVDEMDKACATLAKMVACDGPYRITRTPEWIELSIPPNADEDAPPSSKFFQRAQLILGSMVSGSQPTHWVRPLQDRTALVWNSATV